MSALDTMKSALQCSKTEAAKLRIRVRQLEEKLVEVAAIGEREADELRQGSAFLVAENARLVAANTRLKEEAALYKQRYQEKAAESQTWAAKAGAHAAEIAAIEDAPRGAK